MLFTTLDARRPARTNHPFKPDRRCRADFARQATIDAFGWHFAKALDQADFIDRLPVVCRSLRQRALTF